MEDKQAVRARFKNKRNEFSFDKREGLDNNLFEITVSSNEFKNAKIILAYYPIKNEPNVLKIAEAALLQGKKVAFPISDPLTCELKFKFVNNLSELVIGTYKIPEPSADNQAYCGESHALCIVPALAFDKKGYRIGYGKGYYDRFLSSFKGVSAGLCYDDFLCDSLPIEETDRKVNMIITNKEVIYV